MDSCGDVIVRAERVLQLTRHEETGIGDHAGHRAYTSRCENRNVLACATGMRYWHATYMSAHTSFTDVTMTPLRPGNTVLAATVRCTPGVKDGELDGTVRTAYGKPS